jgi:hypothetical protein
LKHLLATRTRCTARFCPMVDECEVLELTCAAWTAIGTIALAFGTIALVIVTGIYVMRTGRLAGTATRSADAAERTLLLESLPIVLPTTGITIGGSDRVDADVMLTNSGRQPALNGSLWLEADDLSIGPVPFHPIQPDSETTVRLPPQQASFGWTKFKELRMRVEYHDAIGNRYRVQRRQRGSEYDVSLERQVGGEWVPLLSPD